jgi:hypothetical protein
MKAHEEELRDGTLAAHVDVSMTKGAHEVRSLGFVLPLPVVQEESQHLGRDTVPLLRLL